jgi:hypothetical protein
VFADIKAAHGARGGDSHADENRAQDDGDAKPKSIDESHCAAQLPPFEFLQISLVLRALSPQ